MKTYYKSNELAHIWAHESAPHGRCPSSMSFDGDAFNSYNTTIARRIRYKSKVAYVLDDYSFSVSTRKHQNHVRHALSDSTAKFSVNIGGYGQRLEFTPKTLRDYYLNERKAERSEATSRYAHVRAQEINRQEYYLSEAIRVCRFFGLATTKLENERAKCEPKYAQARQVINAHESQREAKREALRLKREAEQLERDRENVPKWLAGESVWLSYAHPCLLRAVNGEMETSKGARVPIAEAERAYRFAVIQRERGWHRNGEQFTVGNYSLDAVNEQGVVAGCHRVLWSEIERFAQLQGWTQ